MDATPSDQILELEAFLERNGLVCQRREGPDPNSFGNRVVQYGNSDIGVRLVLDRGIWSVAVADLVGRRGDWYDAAILRDLLFGASGKALSLPDRIQLIKENWLEIVARFRSDRRDKTHGELAALREPKRGRD
jgi:hypothetical protein